jgi:hypothetical protein
LAFRPLNNGKHDSGQGSMSLMILPAMLAAERSRTTGETPRLARKRILTSGMFGPLTQIQPKLSALDV